MLARHVQTQQHVLNVGSIEYLLQFQFVKRPDYQIAVANVMLNSQLLLHYFRPFLFQTKLVALAGLPLPLAGSNSGTGPSPINPCVIKETNLHTVLV